MKLKLVVFLVTLALNPLLAHAEEGEGGGEKKDEGGTAKPWTEAENRLSSLRTKAAMFEKLLNEAIVERKSTSDRTRAVELEKEVGKNYNQLKSTNEELRKQESIFRYRYPERTAVESERFYKTQEVPDLVQIEEQVGIEGKLNHNLIKMRSQYGTKADKKALFQKAEKLREPASASETTPSTGEKNVREADTVILHK